MALKAKQQIFRERARMRKRGSGIARVMRQKSRAGGGMKQGARQGYPGACNQNLPCVFLERSS